MIVAEIASSIPLSGKSVLEIGAGKGCLTVALAKEAKRVVALELDESLKPALERAVSGLKNVELVFKDARDFDFKGFDVVFGNIPYYIASPLILKVVDSDCPQAALLLQEELALRLAAEPGSSGFSRLSVACQCKYDCRVPLFVPRSCFSPQPRVDSALVVFKLKPERGHLALDDVLVRALFQHKNQTVRNALKHSVRELGLGKAELDAFAKSLGEMAEERVRCLYLEEFAKASKAFAALRQR